MTRKNLFAHAAALASTPLPASAELAANPDATPQRPAARPKVKAIGNLGAILSDMTEGSRRAADLERDLAGSTRVVSIETGLIDPSPVRDRLENPASEDDRALLESISRDGQRVPALVRPNPNADGRYITVYGHRRIAAARTLGIRVRAVIVEMPEEDAFIAQGQENNARLNTSFIERAIFAKRLNERGMKIVRIADALNVVKSVVSESIAVAEALPDRLLEAIGPAPGVGRARWQALAKRIEADAIEWRAVVADSSFPALSTDQRFDRVASGITDEKPPIERPKQTRELVDDGGCYMKVRRTTKVATYAVPLDDGTARSDGLSFADWMEKRIPALREDYRKGR